MKLPYKLLFEIRHDFTGLMKCGSKDIQKNFLLIIMGSLLLVASETFIIAVIQVLFIKSGFLVSSASYPKYLTFLTAQPWSFVVAMLLLVSVCRAYGQFQTIHCATSLQDSTVASLRKLLAKRVLIGNPPFEILPSDAQNLLGLTFIQTGQWMLYFATLISTSILLLSLLALMFYLAPFQALLTLITIGFMGVPIALMLRRAKRQTQHIHTQTSHIVAGVQKILSNWQLVRIYKMANVEFSYISNALENTKSAQSRGSSLNAYAASISPLFGITLLIGVCYVGVQKLGMKTEALLPFLYLLIRFFQNFSVASQSAGNVLHLHQYSRRSNQFLKESAGSQMMDTADPAPRLGFNMKKAPTIDLVNLNISVNGRTIVHNLNLHIPGGSQVAIIGPSGCGKSTLLSVIMGLHGEYQGQIVIDSMPLHLYSNQSSVNFGYVGAHSFLVSGTLRSNLLYGVQRSISDDMLWQLLDRVGLSKDIKKTPEQLDHRINELGEGLSVGQKARICIARALATDAPILILDEATANLDSENEENTVSLISSMKGKMTTIVVSHRPAAIKNADLIVDLSSAPTKIEAKHDQR